VSVGFVFCEGSFASVVGFDDPTLLVGGCLALVGYFSCESGIYTRGIHA